jgi:cholesterol transport system auxiliary component
MIHRTRLATVAACAALAASLAACGGILTVVGPNPNVYTLSPKNTFASELPRVEWQLVVEEPYAAGGLDTNRIAVKPSSYELKYFSDSRWSDRAPKMIQTLLVESFENTGKIVAVGREVVGLRSDFNLKTELREFQAEYTNYGQPPTVRVRLNAKLIRQPRQEIVESRNFEYTIVAKSTAMTDIVEAFDEALGKVLRRSVEWVMASQHQAAPIAGQPPRSRREAEANSAGKPAER